MVEAQPQSQWRVIYIKMKLSVDIMLFFVCTTLLLQEGLGRDINANETPKSKVGSRLWWHIHPVPRLPPWLHPAPSTPKQSPPSTLKPSPPSTPKPSTPSTPTTPSMPVPAAPNQQPPPSGSSLPAWKRPTQQDIQKCMTLLQTIPQCVSEAIFGSLTGDYSHVNRDCCTVIATIVHCSALYAPARPQVICGSSSKSPSKA